MVENCVMVIWKTSERERKDKGNVGERRRRRMVYRERKDER